MLFDSETGTPATKFVAGPLWSAQRHSADRPGGALGPDAWSQRRVDLTAGQSSLTATAPIALPAGQAAYLFFQQWRVLDYDGGGFYDGGTVEIDGAPTAAIDLGQRAERDHGSAASRTRSPGRRPSAATAVATSPAGST